MERKEGEQSIIGDIAHTELFLAEYLQTWHAYQKQYIKCRIIDP